MAKVPKRRCRQESFHLFLLNFSEGHCSRSLNFVLLLFLYSNKKNRLESSQIAWIHLNKKINRNQEEVKLCVTSTQFVWKFFRKFFAYYCTQAIYALGLLRFRLVIYFTYFFFVAVFFLLLQKPIGLHEKFMHKSKK
jgi:hypothetical protein